MNPFVCIPLLPFISFLLLGLFGRQLKPLAGIIATLLMAVSTALSLSVAYTYFFVSGKVEGIYQTLVPLQYKWLEFSPSLSIDMGILIDPISVMMLIVVTVVSLMVHLYSISYMKGEDRYASFFSYLGLFTFSMLALVLSSNIFQIYIFWELVGISSFLLIGFYYDRPSAVKASRKAFIVTRFADLGFLIGILILAFEAHTLDFRVLIERLTHPESEFLIHASTTTFLGASALTWGLVLVFMGGVGKSAMFPMHIWLPDAMEGPTPVSALIHAATMVVAGVYLVARLFPVFAISCPAALDLVMVIGVLSAILAALIACTQTDIKRVLAYSTMSQIGYMMFSLGVARWGMDSQNGFTASMFHLFTHAFFKALLFLAAGVIIHHVHSNEIKAMGGLRKLLPVTHITFLVACLAIAGIPPLSGFFSKEEILLATYHFNVSVFLLALLTSGITAFYMFRLYFHIFWYSPTQQVSSKATHHEAEFVMLLALILLAGGAALSGFIPFSRFVSANGIPFNTSLHYDFSILPVASALTGTGFAFYLYKAKNLRPDRIAERIKHLYTLSYHKFYIDEFYTMVNHSIHRLIAYPSAWIDRQVVDGSVNMSGKAAKTASEGIREMQSGQVHQYVFWFIAGILILAVVVMYGMG